MKHKVVDATQVTIQCVNILILSENTGEIWFWPLALNAAPCAIIASLVHPHHREAVAFQVIF